jgi:hypothetical protein
MTTEGKVILLYGTNRSNHLTTAGLAARPNAPGCAATGCAIATGPARLLERSWLGGLLDAAAASRQAAE